MLPTVSVIVLCYNQEKYICQALDSIVTQKTNFTFEVYVGDDASTDRTPDLVQQYADKYPNIIKPVLRKKNIGANPQYIDLVKKCQGKYLAFLDGDDYWCCSTKLQQHVDFLENHPEYVGICGWVKFVDQKGKPVWHIQGDHEALFQKHTYTMSDFQCGLFPGQGGSAMYRNVYRDFDFEWEKLYAIDPLIGDQISVFLYHLNHQKTYVTHKYFSCYRYISSSIDGNYSSKIKTRDDLAIYYFRYYNALENTYAKLTGKRISLRKRKQHYLSAELHNLFRYPSRTALKRIAAMLKEEKHPFLLLIDVYSKKLSDKITYHIKVR